MIRFQVDTTKNMYSTIFLGNNIEILEYKDIGTLRYWKIEILYYCKNDMLKNIELLYNLDIGIII